MKCEDNGALRGLFPRKSRSTKQVARSGPPQGGLAQKRHAGVNRSLHNPIMLLNLFWLWSFLPQATVMCLMSPDPKPPHSLGGCRSEEHTSELQSQLRISYDVFW